VPEAWRAIVQQYAGSLDTLFIASKVTLATGAPPAEAYSSDVIDGLAVVIVKAPGEKCERCWRFQEDVGASAEHPTVCGRCAMSLQSVS
jgi:isoleucyl-tRNA synthetase